MIKSYLDNVHSKPPHERREHSMQLAMGLTGLAVVIWVTTLGLRYTLTPAQIAQNNPDTGQAASVVESATGNATLMVATTSDTGTGSYFNQ